MPMERIRPANINQAKFCPGCGHGIVVRVINEVLEEKGLRGKSLIAAGVGCSCNVYVHDGDILQCPHGRAVAAARGMKANRPDLFVTTYQGDGDAYVIGIEHTMNAAYHRENILMVTINNSNFGMTGGQMAWTTLPGQVTTTSPKGRALDGPPPIQVPEIIAQSFDPAFVARASVHSVPEINKLKRYVEEAVDAQMNGEGFCMIEVCCPCPTNWGMSVENAYQHVKENVTKYYPLGILKERKKRG